jgi:putative membrane protein
VKRRTPYDDIDPEQLIARDWLALSRSRLANERTLLAYIRTSLAMIGLGALLAKWIDHPSALIGGVALATGGVVVVGVGLVRFVQEDRRYRRLTHSRD